MVNIIIIIIIIYYINEIKSTYYGSKYSTCFMSIVIKDVTIIGNFSKKHFQLLCKLTTNA
jgi:hypothetical protein